MRAAFLMQHEDVLQDSDITAELEHLQLTDVTLVMHDWGGEECLTRVVSTGCALNPNPKP